jgi:hypothetical protein
MSSALHPLIARILALSLIVTLGMIKGIDAASDATARHIGSVVGAPYYAVAQAREAGR